MRILYWGDSPTVATGLGNVSKNLLSHLSRNHEITVIGVNDRGGYKDPKEYPYKIYPAIYDNYYDVWGALRLINVFKKQDKEIKEESFDVFITNLDFFLFSELKVDGITLLEHLKIVMPKDIKKIIYTPIDNEIIYKKWLEVFKFFDRIYVPSYYTRNVLKKYGFNNVKVIYYPLDTQNFYPKQMPDKPKDKFVIGYVGRNQWRKDLFSLIKIFSEFKRRHKEAYLYIHTNPTDKEQQGWNLLDILKHYDLYLYQDYFVPVDLDVNKGQERKKMVDVYNYFDVFLSSSTGEGFGMPYAESLLCEVPIIIPDNTVSKEFEQFSYIYKADRPYSFGFIDYNRIRNLVNIEDGVEKLEYVYTHRKEAKEKAKRGREFFLNYKFDFPI